MLNRTLFSIYNHGKNPVSPWPGRATFNNTLKIKLLISSDQRPIYFSGAMLRKKSSSIWMSSMREGASSITSRPMLFFGKAM